MTQYSINDFITFQSLKLVFKPQSVILQQLFKMQTTPLSRKKNYFTKSQNILPTLHPTQQFASIIAVKKQYQSLIKKELDALQQIQNQEIHHLSQWQNTLIKRQQKPIRHQFSEHVKQIEMNEKNKIIVEQKSSEEFIGCFQKLKIIKVQKQFERLKRNLDLNKTQNTNCRASKFHFENNLQTKYFQKWKETYLSINGNKGVNDINQKNVKATRKAKSFLFFRKEMKIEKQSKQVKLLKTQIAKQFFFNNLAFRATQKVNLNKKQNNLKKIIKAAVIVHLHHIYSHVEECRKKAKLLINIRCHRKINSFLSLCRQLQFHKQRNSIIENILQKINLLQLLQKNNSQISQIQEQSNTTSIINNNDKSENCSSQLNIESNELSKKPTLNIQLLTLIIQNFIEEYMQQYEIVLNQDQLAIFANQLKIKCFMKLNIEKQKKQFFIQLNSSHRIQSSFNAIILKRKKQFYLHLIHLIQTKKTMLAISSMFKKQAILQLRQQFHQNRQLKKSSSILMSNKSNKLAFSKQFTTKLKDNIAESKKYKFKLDIAKQWRNSHLLRTALSLWKQANLIISQDQKKQQQNIAIPQDGNYFEHSPPKIKKAKGSNKELFQSQKLIRKSQSEDEESAKQESVDPFANNARINKAKLQLSKIVSEISKGVNLQMHPLNINKYSVSQQPKIGTVNSLKAQSDRNQQIIEQIQQNQQNQMNSLQNKAKNMVYDYNKRYFFKMMKKQYLFKVVIEQIKNNIKKKSIKKIRQQILIDKQKNQKIKQIRFTFIKSKKAIFLKQFQKFYDLQINKRKCKEQFIFKSNISFLTNIKDVWSKAQTLKQKEQQVEQYLKKSKLMHAVKIIRSQIEFQHTFNLLSDIKSKQREYNIKIILQNWLKQYKFSKLKLKIKDQRRFNFKVIFFKQLKLKESQKQTKQQQLQQQKFVTFQHKNIISPLSPLKQGQPFPFVQANIKHTNFTNLKDISQSHDQSLQSQQIIANYLSNNKPINSNCHNHASPKHNQFNLFKPNQKQFNEQENNSFNRYIQNQSEQDQYIAETIQNKQIQNTHQIQEQVDILDQSFTEEEFTYYSSEIKKILVRPFIIKLKQKVQLTAKISKVKYMHLIKFTSAIEAIQQSRIRQQQLQQILIYSQQKYEVRLKRKVFSGFNQIYQISYKNNLIQKCFKGWQMFGRQKMLLKKYLQAQEIEKGKQLTYYPQTIEQKHKYEQLKNS